MYSFSYLEPVCCSVSSSNCCFLTFIQVSQEAGQVVWYCHLFQNFPQFIAIHIVKGFGIVHEAEIDVFLNSLAFSMIQRMLGIWSLVPLPFLKPAWTSGNSRFMYCRRLAWRILSITLLVCAAAAKSLQLCPTLCDPIDGSPPGPPVPGISRQDTGVGCHFLLPCMKVKSESEIVQSCPTLSNPMDCSLPGFSACGIF